MDTPSHGSRNQRRNDAASVTATAPPYAAAIEVRDSLRPALARSPSRKARSRQAETTKLARAACQPIVKRPPATAESVRSAIEAISTRPSHRYSTSSKPRFHQIRTKDTANTATAAHCSARLASVKRSPCTLSSPSSSKRYDQ